MSSLLFSTGTLVLLHAAYSCLHFREIVKDLEESEDVFVEPRIPPLDVIVEVAIGFFLILVAELTRDGSRLQPITKTSAQRPMMAPPYKSREYDVYSTRGKAL